MNTTIGIGGVILIIGFFTNSKFKNRDIVSGAGAFLMFMGAFLVWNGYVADYNEQLDFAIFG